MAKITNHLGIILLVHQKQLDLLFIDTNLPKLDTARILQSVREESPETHHTFFNDEGDSNA